MMRAQGRADRDLCSMELACRAFYKVLSRPSGTGLCGRVLDLRTSRLRALSPEAFRGLQRRMFRYSNMLSDFSDVSMTGSETVLQ
ncbi:g2450 [Coccomyxa viridis]|uniref:G2450 protein n=1 Tax=Coccomyxa viridis TaxID=1274662 RepID=A0ABP1FKF0_9CHLO